MIIHEIHLYANSLGLSTYLLAKNEYKNYLLQRILTFNLEIGYKSDFPTMFRQSLFHSTFVSALVWSTILLSVIAQRVLYPTHFQVAPGATIIRKGVHSHIESYSAFWDYAKTNETALREYLKARKITDVYVCGIAIDICIGKYKQ